MSFKKTLVRAWDSLWKLSRKHDVPATSRVLIISLIAVIMALGLMIISAIFVQVQRPNWWLASLLPNVGICLCILYTLFGVLRLAERYLPTSFVERMSNLLDLRAGLALGALALGGIIFGLAVGFTIVPFLVSFGLWGMFISLPAPLTKFALFLIFLLAANSTWSRSRLRQQRLQKEASDAHLRLLLGQIEPHLLFNTLANVQSLMDYDPPRAKHMLETFSSYLRTSLSQLRHTESTLEAELTMVDTFLSLLKIRMEERLAFHIDANAAARTARMPTLMLQPLVENAIYHGLEPKLDGGRIVVSAKVIDGRLEVRVVDDGIGLAVPSRRLRPGSGMALASLRARLRTQFGNDASLTLQDCKAGTEAVLALPYSNAALHSIKVPA